MYAADAAVGCVGMYSKPSAGVVGGTFRVFSAAGQSMLPVPGSPRPTAFGELDVADQRAGVGQLDRHLALGNR